MFAFDGALLIFAAAYGGAMKVADLLNEHGLKWFTGANILFGVIWGIFGSLLVLSDTTIANILFAMNLAFIVRNRLDYLNHQIAATLVIIAYVFSAVLMPALFLTFFAVFVLFGSLKDYVDDVLKYREGVIALCAEGMLYYPIPTFIYCLTFGHWIVFWVFLVYTIAYNATKIVGRRYGYV